MYKSTRLRWRRCLGAVAACWAGIACAQSSSPDVRLQLERQQQLQQQQLEQDRSLQNRESNPFRTPPSSESGSANTAAISAPAGECHHYARIEIDGANHLRSIYRDTLLAPFADRCLTQQDAEALAASITRYYLEGGYVTTHAYVKPPNAIAPDVLVISVVEGVLERYEVEGPDIPLSVVFPHTVGQVLNMRDLEEGIDHLNALPSNNVTAQIEPGEAVGGSVVHLRNQRNEAPWRAFFSVDSEGNSATGRFQAAAGLTLDNPLGLADQLSTSIRRSSPWNEPAYRSTSVSALYDIPFGYNTFTIGVQTSDYSQRLVLPSGTAVETNGTTGSLFVKLEHLLYRDQDAQVSISGKLQGEHDSTFFGGQELLLQSPRLTIFDGDITLKHRIHGGWLTTSFGISSGLRALGSSTDGESTGPRAQFKTLHTETNANTLVSIAGQQFSFSTSLNAQWSPDMLYPTEQMLIGGPYTVRGFDSVTASGSTGCYIRNDLSWLLRGSAWGAPTLFAPYIGLDAGRIWRANSVQDTSAALVGTTLGVRWNAGPVALDGFYSMPARWLKFVPREKGLLYFQATFNL